MNDCLYTLNLPGPPAMYQRWTEGSFFHMNFGDFNASCWGTQGCPTWVLMCRCSGGDWRCHLALLPRRETVTSRPKGNTGMSWLQPDAKKHKCWGLGTSWLGSAFQGNLVLSPPSELRFRGQIWNSDQSTGQPDQTFLELAFLFLLFTGYETMLKILQSFYKVFGISVFLQKSTLCHWIQVKVELEEENSDEIQTVFPTMHFVQKI